MQFKKLTLKDKTLFKEYLSLEKHSLSTYAFENIFIWQGLYDIFWKEIDKSLCIFFKDRVGCFLYLPPLARRDKHTLHKCFGIMDKFNKNSTISRIENVEEDDLAFYKDLGYKIVLGGCDYVCKRESLASLKGVAFKKKRNLVNNFVGRYNFQYEPYKSKDKRGCLDLYLLWMDERKQKNQDKIYQRLLADNFSAFKIAVDNYSKLNFLGRVIKIDGKIKAFTLGYELSKASFVVLFEVCDLKFKGIAQYIFKEFCSELNYKDINIMDDSGLENFKKVKLSYRPYKTVNNFIVSHG